MFEWYPPGSWRFLRQYLHSRPTFSRLNSRCIGRITKIKPIFESRNGSRPIATSSLILSALTIYFQQQSQGRRRTFKNQSSPGWAAQGRWEPFQVRLVVIMIEIMRFHYAVIGISKWIDREGQDFISCGVHRSMKSAVIIKLSDRDV